MSDTNKEKDLNTSGIKRFIAETKLFGLSIPQLFMILLIIFMLLTFIGVIKLSFSAIAGVALVGLLIYGYIDLVIVKGKSFDDLLQNDSKSVIQFISASSTVAESVGLIIIATDARGISFASATIRFGLIGLLEVLFTFLFISVFHKTLYTEIGKALWGDKHINFLEKVWIFIMVSLKTIPFFLLALSITNFIWILYLESIYNVELYITGVKFWEFSIAPINIEGMSQTPELSAWFMVFATPILNVMLVVFELKSINQKLDNDEIPQVKPLSVLIAEKKAARKATAPPSPTPSSTPAVSATPPPNASGSTPSPSKKKEEYEPESVTGLFAAMYQYFCEESKNNDFIRQDPLSDIISERYGIIPKSFYTSSLYETLVGQNSSLKIEELFNFIGDNDVIEVSLDEYVKSMYAVFGITYEGDLFDKSSQIKVKLEKLPTTVDSYYNKLSTTSNELAVELHDVVFEKYQIKDGTHNNKKIHLLISENFNKLEEYSKEFSEIKNKVSSLNPVNNAAEISALETKKKSIISSSQELLKNTVVIIQLLHSACGVG